MLSSGLSAMRHAAASMKSVLPSSPPSMHAKHGMSSCTRSSTSPPSRTRPTRLSPNSPTPVQIAPSASMQIPSGPTPSAQTPRFQRPPSSAMSNAVSRPAKDSAMISVELAGVTAMPLGERDPIGYPAHGPVRGNQSDDPGGPPLTRLEVAAAVDVDVAAAVDDDLVEIVDAQAAQVGMAHQRTVGVPAHDPLARNEQAPVGKPVDRPPETRRALANDLRVALRVNGDDLPRAPVGEPKALLVPTRRLADHETRQQRLRRKRR